jgi:methionyl-tRNA formyltransferase
LRLLLDSDRHHVVAVLTRPDRPAGRGRQVVPSPVKDLALEAGIPVLTPASLRDPAAVELIAAARPDACPVVAYGALIPAALLAVPEHGWVNLHFSLLPAWRGAAPVAHAVLAGDEITGATTFRLDDGLDTGPVLGTITEPIGPRDTAGEVLDRLSRHGATLLAATLDGLADGRVRAVPQVSDGVSHAPKITVADAQVDWTAPALRVDRLVRATTPRPGAWSTWRGERIRLGPLNAPPAPAPPADSPDSPPPLAPGEVRVRPGGDVEVGTGTHPLLLGTVQRPGRTPVPAPDWARGARPGDGERFG